ncbi:glycosyltransferase family 4 protein [Oryzifoliimicrobium ureilyticus]|uniref:glycosyltransferase family 4 protein n=1 Tax=Oryzifoliimicrobium ureilyticus TaxID=3113724 RepID=UPI00307636B2
MVAIENVEVIAPHFKRRLSGVTSTLIQLIPAQVALGQKIATLGPGLPERLPHIRFSDLFQLWTPPAGRRMRIWHARRNIEMLPAILMRDVFRMPLRIVFTSASQRHHTGWTKWLISRMDAVVSTSEKTASYLEVPSTVIMHGINADRFAPPTDKIEAKRACNLDPQQNFVGCFGRIRHQKGTDLFVDAMIKLLPSRPQWSAVIAGRATEKHVTFEKSLREKVEAAGLSERILFVGEHKDIERWYQALDLFVAPQRWEGFGLTPLEAMASGVPVLATDVGAFPELMKGGQDSTGMIIPRDDLAAMEAGAGGIMDNNDARSLMAENALRHARSRFAIETEARRLAQLYNTILNQ